MLSGQSALGSIDTPRRPVQSWSERARTKGTLGPAGTCDPRIRPAPRHKGTRSTAARLLAGSEEEQDQGKLGKEAHGCLPQLAVRHRTRRRLKSMPMTSWVLGCPGGSHHATLWNQNSIHHIAASWLRAPFNVVPHRLTERKSRA